MRKIITYFNNKTLKCFVAAMILLAAPAIQAQDETQNFSFTLNEAIQHALEYNRTVINSERDIAAANKKKWETIATGLPQISASGNYQYNFELQKNVVPAEFFGGNPGEFVEVAFGTKHSVDARATLNQLIFDGSYIVGLKAAKVYLAYYENSKQKTDIEVKEQVINAYGNVLLLQESVAILEKNKATLQKNYTETNESYKNGLSEEEDVEQISITLAKIDSSLKNAVRLSDISLNMLKIILGIELNDELVLTDKLESLTEENLDLSIAAEEFNVEQNIDYKLGKINTIQQELLMKQEKSKALPTLSTNLAFGYNGFNNDFSFFQSNQQWLNYSYLGVSLNVPIFSSLQRSARTQQAKIALEQARTQQEELEQNLKLRYQQAKSEYEYSIEEYFTSKNNLRLAERIENKQQIKFKEGLSSSFEFTEAQRQLYAAQQDYLDSMTQVIDKRAALEKLTAQ
ncbi:TolC family protein [Flavobacterium beibuense]|uniref:Outer membrane protein n=1 Tax=Flavobacterium beibuense TaxID=657326 RepID=A0A444W6L5_9FLAO|nr:TolC family protein [Flavobacterium beibuense]RYJ41392.1 Outer membrane protein [Flavobacterium beibuense]